LGDDETIAPATKPFFAGAQNSGNDTWLQAVNEAANGRETEPRRRSMRSLSFIILAFGFVLAGSSMAGSVDGGLPGVGTFSYNGSPVPVASQPLMVAAR
jgi:hypothetical protein